MEYLFYFNIFFRHDQSNLYKQNFYSYTIDFFTEIYNNSFNDIVDSLKFIIPIVFILSLKNLFHIGKNTLLIALRIVLFISFYIIYKKFIHLKLM